MTVYIVCEVDVWKIPNFDHVPISLGFARKIDFLIADIDGDGYITDADAEQWYMSEAVNERKRKIETSLPNWTNDREIVVQAGKRTQPVEDRLTLAWFKDESKEWLLPTNVEYAVIAARLVYLRKALITKRQRYEIAKEPINIDKQGINTKLRTHIPESVKYKELQQRIMHIYRTYVRL